MQAKIDSFEQYLDPELCSQKMTQSPDSETPTKTTSPKSGPSMPRESLAVKPTTSPENERYPAITDDLGETEENLPPDLSTASTADKTDSQTSHMGRKRTHDIAFNKGSERMSPATTKSSVSKRRLQDPDQFRKQIMTDMETLVEVYQDFARVSVESMDVPVGSRGLKVLDMANLEKPTSYPECVQQLMNALNANALHECFDDAFEALDYDVADTLCNASRALLNHYRQVYHAHNDDSSPNEAQKRACEKFKDGAKRYLQILEQMTKGDATAKVIDVEWSGDSKARLEQLIQLATVDGAVYITVDVVMQYMQAARVRRADNTLHDFLVKVRRMTKALGSAIEDLKELQS